MSREGSADDFARMLGRAPQPPEQTDSDTEAPPGDLEPEATADPAAAQMFRVPANDQWARGMVEMLHPRGSA